ncbi:lysine-rich nucleolar protein 1 [Erythrolamprus reginae]|uniref:lysine-rich nucleolar protein 1 n=1 Tax=Erythrolamprus reginae TaxID=121349 RepID=UPI00396CBDF6
MKNPEQVARKRNKAGEPNCGQVIIIDSPKRRCSDLGKEAKPKKLKRLAKETSSGLPDPKNETGASSPVVIIESSSDSELSREAKKRKKALKKEKKRKLFCIQIQNSDGRDEGQPGTGLHVSTKCSKIVLEVGRNHEELPGKRKKKKKEKRIEKKLPSFELLHSGDSEEPVDEISRELKLGGQKISSRRKKNKQKAVEKKHYEGDPENVSKKDIAGYGREDAQSRDGPMERWDDLPCKSEKDSGTIKKKKKKLKKISPSLPCLAKIKEKPCDVTSGDQLTCGSEKEPTVRKSLKEVDKAAKKEAQKRKIGKISRLPEVGRDISAKKLGTAGGKEKRKKAKKRKAATDETDRCEGRQKEEMEEKWRKDGIENAQDVWKKIKKEKEAKKEFAENDVKLVAFRKGNCDEVSIDKVRRQALQEEIDRESGKTKIAKESDNRLGQWSTATFETLEEKTKFHRLLGGFKKGLDPAQSSPANANKPKMALDRPSEQELQHNLEAEFKKAVEFKHHRGIGLGFQSNTRSGIHIDKYASKSVKFEA